MDRSSEFDYLLTKLEHDSIQRILENRHTEYTVGIQCLSGGYMEISVARTGLNRLKIVGWSSDDLDSYAEAVREVAQIMAADGEEVIIHPRYTNGHLQIAWIFYHPKERES